MRILLAVVISNEDRTITLRMVKESQITVIAVSRYGTYEQTQIQQNNKHADKCQQQTAVALKCMNSNK